MGFTLVEYEMLKGKVQVSISTYVGQAQFDATRMNKAHAKLTDGNRRIQCQCLLKLMELLDAPACPEQFKNKKNLILNGAVFHIRSQIFNSYVATSATNSDLYKLLTSSLGITKKNTPENDDLFQMYGLLEKFLRANAYNTEKGICDPELGHLKERPFSAIRDYSIDDDICELSEVLSKLKIEKIKYYKNHPEGKQKTNSNNANAGFFGSSNSGSSATSTSENDTKTNNETVTEGNTI
ncbi:MAG: hypothetical protein WC627_09745 [Legionella sp.]|jgi:hypothetical protein